jgi:hypothetical protein
MEQNMKRHARRTRSGRSLASWTLAVGALAAAVSSAQTPSGGIFSRHNSVGTTKEYYHYVDFDQRSEIFGRPYYAVWEHEVQGFRTYMDINFHQQDLSPFRCYDYTFLTTAGVPRPDWQFFINTGTADDPRWLKVADNAAGTVSPRVRLWISGLATRDRTVLRLSSANTAEVNNHGAAFMLVKELSTNSASTCLGIGSGNAGLVAFTDNRVVQYFTGP